MSDTITKDMIIREVRDRYPGITAVFQAHGLPCAGCSVGSYESIAGGARTHNLDLDAILADLNRFARDGTVPAATGHAPAMARTPRRENAQVPSIKHIVAIVSGKGGVGKSLVTGLLAITLQRQGYKVGILDGDITGPSIPRMFNIPARSLTQVQGQDKPEPPRSPGGLPIMSMNVLLDDPEAAVVWRGPMISGAIRQFYTDMNWGQLDYLLVDLPPGTSDAPMTVMQQLPTDGAIIVSTPQGLATMVVSKAISMVKKFEVPIIGIVENMSYVTLPDGTPYELFGPSQGQRLVGLSGAPLLGRLPIDPQIATLADEGRIEEYDSEAYQALAKNFLIRLEQGDGTGSALPIISSRSLAGATAGGPRPGARPLPPRTQAPTNQGQSTTGADIQMQVRRDGNTGGDNRPAAPSAAVPGSAGHDNKEKDKPLLRLGRFLRQPKN